MSQNILITGSSGFLGLKLCNILSKSSHNITALDLKVPTEKFENINYETNSINEYLKN
jgi:nucleoside-diphosphate-sugar epimerase